MLANTARGIFGVAERQLYLKLNLGRPHHTGKAGRAMHACMMAELNTASHHLATAVNHFFREGDIKLKTIRIAGLVKLNGRKGPSFSNGRKGDIFKSKWGLVKLKTIRMRSRKEMVEVPRTKKAVRAIYVTWWNACA
jgi:hypothetical protein